ncbi:MAG: hypothetical protein MJZ97_01035 [Bacteroidales bacterium]|nr:hypothetical protein [Bacteroidales bacterium]
MFVIIDRESGESDECGLAVASPCLPDADMMNREFHESSEWALLSQALACRTLI